MQLDEGDLTQREEIQLRAQIFNTVKTADPGTHTQICERTGMNAFQGKCGYVVSGRVGRIWKHPLPRLDHGAVCRVEPDVSEKVFSGPGDPRFGDETTCFERDPFGA